MTAAESLTEAMVQLTDQGQSPPCGHSPDAWMSTRAGQRAAAAIACQPCPLLTICAAYGDEIHARFGVFGGRDRTPKPRKAKTP